jgi:hypothetical protein
MEARGKKTLGKAIDEIIAAVEALDEPARMTAVRAACEHLGLTVPNSSEGRRDEPPSPPAPPVPPAASSAGAGEPPKQAAVYDIRSFKGQKAPGNAIEMACVVAYFLESLAGPAERKGEVSAADLEKYFKQGGYPLPKRMPQLLVNARGAGYLDSTGHGKYKLNPVGHNLVAHKLPKKSSK